LSQCGGLKRIWQRKKIIKQVLRPVFERGIVKSVNKIGYNQGCHNNCANVII
jgi:hypothetical protein